MAGEEELAGEGEQSTALDWISITVHSRQFSGNPKAASLSRSTLVVGSDALFKLSPSSTLPGNQHLTLASCDFHARGAFGRCSSMTYSFKGQ